MYNFITLSTSLFDSIIGSGFSITTCLIIFGVAAVMGLLISLTYLYIKRKCGYSVEFPITLVVLPIVCSMIIYFVRDNIAGGLTLGGVFALTRFRSEQKDTEDLAYVFLTMAIGLTCGLGYVAAGAIIGVLLLLVLLLLYFTKYGSPSIQNMNLKIIVPEDINYDNLFDDILNQYCTEWHLNKVRSTDFGTMFELSYRITVRKRISQKDLIDAIRVKNGNLNVTLTVRRYSSGDIR